MKVSVLSILMLAAGFISTASAADRPTVFDFEFSFTSPTSASTTIPDNNVLVFMLPQTLLNVDPSELINYLELEITGLTHDAPWDLNISILDPMGLKIGNFGSGITIMEDAGSDFVISDMTLLFADKGGPLPLTSGEGALQGFPDNIYQPLGPGSFSQFNGTAVGTAPWLIVISDDAAGRVGSFESITLRGSVVPEPATLTLLAIGALATFRRRRR